MRRNLIACKNFLFSNKGISFGILTIGLMFVLFAMPNVADTLYRQGLFQLFRLVFDHTFGLIPFPLLYLEIILFPFFVFYYLKKIHGKIGRWILFPLNLIGWFAGIFFWFWGFNYSCNPLFNDLQRQELTEKNLYDFGIETIQTLNRKVRSSDYNLSVSESNSLDIQNAVEHQIQLAGIKTYGHPKYQSLGMSGALRRLGIAGIYIPHTGQAHGDKSFPDVTEVFIQAHELAHAYGVTSESEADFIAYLALTQNQKGNELLIYSGQLELLRTIRHQLREQNDSLRISLDEHIPPGVMHDIQLIRMNARLYPEFFPGMQENVNDTYLKALGLKDGVQNYDRFVDLAFAYQQRD